VGKLKFIGASIAERLLPGMNAEAAGLRDQIKDG